MPAPVNDWESAIKSVLRITSSVIAEKIADEGKARAPDFLEQNRKVRSRLHLPHDRMKLELRIDLLLHDEELLAFLQTHHKIA